MSNFMMRSPHLMMLVPKNMCALKLGVERCSNLLQSCRSMRILMLNWIRCSEPGCFKHFTNEQCLKAHIQSCHQHIICETCGTKQLKKNIKRHLRMHESGCTSERVKCHFMGCVHTFSTKSNLDQHVKAVHLKLRPFVCGIPGCGMRFPFNHVRDNHEKTGCHVYTYGDFEELDEQFRLRPKGGRKRKSPPIEALLRKRVTPPSQSDSVLCQGSEYLSWLLSSDAEDQQ